VERVTKAISFDKISKKYGNKGIFQDLSFSINTQDVVGLLGPSGVGKTTILKLIASLEKPTSGKIDIFSKKISYVFQEPRLFPWKTTLENVVLPLRAAGFSKKKAIEKAKYSLYSMELSDFTGYYPSKLSGGMRQRVSLARALSLEPDILLLDEPFSALDTKMKDSLVGLLIQKLKERPMTVLYISHFPQEVEKIANKIFTISNTKRLTETLVPIAL
jgi:NitT/TauT family transport system ATP-binding protein